MNEVCPHCRQATAPRREGDPLGWRFCPACGWDERIALNEKMRGETKNWPGP